MSTYDCNSQTPEQNVFEHFFDLHQDWLLTNAPMSPSSMTSSAQTPYDQLSIRGSSPDLSVAGDQTLQKSSRTGSKLSPCSRKIQNRKAQRAFRARQKQHVESLEEKLQSILSAFEHLQQNYKQLQNKYDSLLLVQDEVADSSTDQLLALTQDWKPSTGEEQEAFFDDFLLTDETLLWNSPTPY